WGPEKLSGACEPDARDDGFTAPDLTALWRSLWQQGMSAFSLKKKKLRFFSVLTLAA
ncbi:hypothetical protein TorRG33x02_255060, partial [Trema orientale]